LKSIILKFKKWVHRDASWLVWIVLHQKFNLAVNYHAFNIENVEVITVDNGLREILSEKKPNEN